MVLSSVQGEIIGDRRPIEILSSLSYRTGEISDYLTKVADGLKLLLNLDWTVVTLLDADTYTDRILASTKELGDDRDRLYSLHGSLTEYVVKTRKPLVVANTQLTSEYGQAPEGYFAYLGVPLRSPTGCILGTICSFQHQPRDFDPDEIQLAELFADRAATAIDNYQLYEQQQHLNDQLVATNERLQAEVLGHQATEAALRVSETKFRRIFEASNDAIFVIDPERDQIVEVNPQAAEMLGYSQEELLTKVSVSDVHPDEMPALQAFSQQVLTEGKGWTNELTCLTRWGTKLPAEISAAPIECNGRRCILAMVRNMSDRIRAQREMMRMLEQLAEVGELTAMIVHEIRNPLTTVMMGLNSFQRLDLSDRFQERLDLSLDEAQRLQALLDEILLYAKPQTLQLESIELNDFIPHLLETIRDLPSTDQRLIQLELSHEPVWISGDRNKLKQVFMNLVTNACEAIAPGETVTWSIHPADPHPETDTTNNEMDAQICITLHNDGDPIPPEVLPKLTKPFFTTKASGTGLGLAIVKRIVEAHQGTLTITSSKDTGTTVQITLPVLNIDRA